MNQHWNGGLDPHWAPRGYLKGPEKRLKWSKIEKSHNFCILYQTYFWNIDQQHREYQKWLNWLSTPLESQESPIGSQNTICIIENAINTKFCFLYSLLIKKLRETETDKPIDRFWKSDWSSVHLIFSLICPSIHLFFHSLINSFNLSFIHSSFHSLLHSLIHFYENEIELLEFHLQIGSWNLWFIYSFIHKWIFLFVHFIHKFINFLTLKLSISD